MIVLSYSPLNGILWWSIITDVENGDEVEFVATGITVEDGKAAIGLGNEQHIDLAPAGRAVVEGLARKQEPVASIVELVEASAQTLLVRHE